MRPLIILLITCTTLPCYVNGVDVEQRAYHRVLECIYICTHADDSEGKLPVATVICDAHKVRARSNFLGSSKAKITVKCIFD